MTHTCDEINAQPDIWREWASPLAVNARDIRNWIAGLNLREVWVSGAGSSAYIGDTLARQATSASSVLSLPTTDLVSCPGLGLSRQGSVLSVQFGRSGNSSETIGLIDLLDLHRPDIHRLQITCNEDSALATRQGPGDGETRTLILPEKTHDRGFAMTSSFTTIYLSALACLDTGFDTAAVLPALAKSASVALPELWEQTIKRPSRAIFLGSGELTAIAQESALKVLELTAGRTLTQWNSTLGFRHGPKAAVDADTAVFVMIHADPQTARYDLDLVSEIRQQFPEAQVFTIGKKCDIPLNLTGTAGDPVLYVLPAQVLAHQWSEEMGLHVDDPFAGQNLTRVVSGVKLYGWTA